MPAGVLRARMNNPIKYRATLPERRSKPFGNNLGRYIVDRLTNPGRHLVGHDLDEVMEERDSVLLSSLESGSCFPPHDPQQH